MWNENPTKLQLPGFKFKNAYSISGGEKVDFIEDDTSTYEIDSKFQFHIL
jgi:hypothetical protein